MMLSRAYFCNQLALQYSSCLRVTTQLNSALNSLPNTHLANHDQKRSYRRKILTWPVDYLPFKWTYPPKKNFLQESGDLIRNISEPDPLEPRGIFKHSVALKTAPEPVKRLFSVSHGSRRELRATIEDDFYDLVRRYPGDNDSFEIKIARHTFKIRSLLTEYYNGKMTREKRMKVAILESIASRNKLLNKLWKLDTERYELVKKKLGVVHEPNQLGVGYQKITRKGELRRLTSEYAENLKQKKLDEFHEVMKAEQELFEKDYKEFQEWLKKEEEELQLTPEEKASTEYVSSLEETVD